MRVRASTGPRSALGAALCKHERAGEHGSEAAVARRRCRTQRPGTGMLVHEYVHVQRACVHIVCTCVSVCVDTHTHKDMRIYEMLTLTFVPAHAHHAHGRIHACTDKNVYKCMCVSACEGRNERERERERARARAYVCMCMCAALCMYVCMGVRAHMIALTSIMSICDPYTII